MLLNRIECRCSILISLQLHSINMLVMIVSIYWSAFFKSLWVCYWMCVFLCVCKLTILTISLHLSDPYGVLKDYYFWCTGIGYHMSVQTLVFVVELKQFASCSRPWYQSGYTLWMHTDHRKNTHTYIIGLASTRENRARLSVCVSFVTRISVRSRERTREFVFVIV